MPPGPLWRYGGPLALLVGLFGLSGLASARYAGHVPLTEREHEYLAYRTDRTEFDEWITEARFPAERVDDADTSIETTSLAGLVDLAIDTDRRVIEVADRDSYLVIDGDVVYRYDAPILPEEGDDPLASASAGASPGDVEAADTDQPAAGGVDEAPATEASGDGTGSDSSEADSNDSLFARLQGGGILGGDEPPSEDGADSGTDQQSPDTAADDQASDEGADEREQSDGDAGGPRSS